MSWSQSDIDALDTAIKSGVTRVRFADREITYRSMKDLLQARALAVVEVAASNGTIPNRQIRVYTSKGFGN